MHHRNSAQCGIDQPNDRSMSHRQPLAQIHRMARRPSSASQTSSSSTPPITCRRKSATPRRNISAAIFRARCSSTSTPSPIPRPICRTCCRGRSSSATAAGALGIAETDTIVVYDGTGLYSAPRVWWTFRIFGAKNVFILDGGSAGLEGGRPPARSRRGQARAAQLQGDDGHRRGRHALRRADGAQRRQRAGGRRALGRPLCRPRGGAARRLALRPHAGRAQRAVRRHPGERPPGRARKNRRMPSRRPASISTSR